MQALKIAVISLLLWFLTVMILGPFVVMGSVELGILLALSIAVVVVTEGRTPRRRASLGR